MVRARSTSTSTARQLLATQKRLQPVDSRRARAHQPRERLTVPRRRVERKAIPAWSPRAQVERRPMRRLRFARDLW